MNHIIRFVKYHEIESLQNFIKKYWKEDHIFVKNRQLLEWQYLNSSKNTLNFIAAFRKDTQEIDAIRGYISPSHFDNNIQSNDIWLSIWKRRDDIKVKSLGIQLYFSLIKELKPESIGSLGISTIALEIYKKLKFNIGRLEHYYIKNFYKKTFNIASLSTIQNPKKITDYIFNDWNKNDFPVKTISCSPSKSCQYFINRYLNHPMYSYAIKSIRKDGGCKAIFVYRKILIGQSSCLRIVDWYGDFIRENIAFYFQDILNEENAEYIDFLCYSIDSNIIQKMGFSLKSNSDIIPEHFEPFVNKNIEIFYAYKSKKKYSIFKGDSDQDRPNF